MNNILELKGKFESKSREGGSGFPKLPSKKDSKVTIEHLEHLKRQLSNLKEFWSKEQYVDGGLISIFYDRVLAKSNRVSLFFSNGKIKSNDTIVGAKFSEEYKHIITHHVTIDMIQDAIDYLNSSINVIKENISTVEITKKDVEIIGSKDIKEEDVDKIHLKEIKFENYNISKSNFLFTVVDSYYIEKFDILQNEDILEESSIITIYDIKKDAINIMKSIGLDNIFSSKILDNTTILLTSDEIKVLKQKAPYLIAMEMQNETEMMPEVAEDVKTDEVIIIPEPKNEPTIGVIDTLFDDHVYFSKWVDSKKMIDDEIPTTAADYFHATTVCSLIVDGATINPSLDDGCGRFKVRHFGVATSGKFSSFTILKAIKEIVTKNKDIKVWNLSLGSSLEVNPNFISVEGAILDKIQYENDIIFVIAGTNKNTDSTSPMRIGAPADSINSIVVNSVDFDKQPATYSREGIVLSFFNKPDISYYGGNKTNKIKVCSPTGEAAVAGTSYAAPWVARKLAYLIEILGINRELAKALLIDSAADWTYEKILSKNKLVGFGIVPQKIQDIIESSNDEIKFVITGTSEKYDTYSYQLPVPIDNDNHPYEVKATLCYFPKCSRNQGVDYTDTELDIYIGRINNKGKFDPINGNKQSIDEEGHYCTEKNARNMFRKWDNVKHISPDPEKRLSAKKAYINPSWGISVKRKSRLSEGTDSKTKFGLVVTLKEINGKNRIETFIQQCQLKGWLVNRIDVENKIDIYTKLQEEIKF